MTAWTVANVMMMLAFAFAAVVQLNDPDPLRWTAIYASAAVICGLELTRRVQAIIPAMVSLTALAWSATIAPRVIGTVPFASMFAEFEMHDVGVEESREMYGLLIVAVWIAIVAWASRARRASTTESPIEGG